MSYLTTDKPTNGELLVLVKDREYDMRVCNLDKRALRAWYEGYRKACGWRCSLRER